MPKTCIVLLPQQDCIPFTLKCNSAKIHNTQKHLIISQLQTWQRRPYCQKLKFWVNTKSVGVTILYWEFLVGTCTDVPRCWDVGDWTSRSCRKHFAAHPRGFSSSGSPVLSPTQMDYHDLNDWEPPMVCSTLRQTCFLNPPCDRSRWIPDHYLLLPQGVCVCVRTPVSTCKQSEPFTPAQ